ncbi:MAG: non-canonical purine NTP pyrophosphatase, partial [Planctomycetota bacterium]
MGKVTLLIGSKNARKAEEMRRFLADLPLRVVSLQDLPEELPPAEESADDFVKNAEAKALHYAGLTGLLTVADDSGLCVDAL